MHEDSITYPVKLITRVTLLSEHPNPSCLLLIHRHNNRNVPARCERFENTCAAAIFPTVTNGRVRGSRQRRATVKD
jgi:hypothetical protein